MRKEKNSHVKSSHFSYPPTKRIPVKENIHGHEIVDFYRWLERLDDPEVRDWIYKQNAFTRNILDNLPGRRTIELRLKELFPHGILSAPVETKCGWFYLQRDANENQSKLCLRYKDPPNDEKILVNPNALDSKGLTTIDWFYPSENGNFVAFGLSKGGDEWSVLHVIHVPSGNLLSETISRTRFCTVRWKQDESGFFYTKYPEIGEVPPGEEFYHGHVRYHALGTRIEEDPVIFKNDARPRDFPLPFLSPDETFLLVTSHRFVSADLHFVKLTSDFPSSTSIIENNTWMIKNIEMTDKYIYILASKDSPNYMIYRATKDSLMPENWEPLIEPPEGAMIVDFRRTKEYIAVLIQQDVSHHLYIYEPEGELTERIKLPSFITINELKANRKSNLLTILCNSFNQPHQALLYNIDLGTTNAFSNSSSLHFNRFSSFQVSRIWYESKDGTRVHMYLYHPKNVVKNGQNPTILYGYGGFGISLLPFFSPQFQIWVELGGVVAVANIRGGNELGETWHESGRLNKKQNVFDDFIAAAEHLIAENICSPSTLAIVGGSNGGLLVGAVLTQRHDLFAAVYCAVPLLDMIRYHEFSMAKAWIPEYGDPRNPEHFKWLHAYSPYHHVKEGEKYPAVLFHTAEADNRVDPCHAMKMTALMQHATASKESPILLYVESGAGHGAGKPINKRILQYCDMITFLAWRLGLPLED